MDIRACLHAEDSYIILNTTRRRGAAVHSIHVLPGSDERGAAAAVAMVPSLEGALGGPAKVAVALGMNPAFTI
jgi:hypothetical protein